MVKRRDIRIGVGGWTYEPWRGTFYPEKLPQKRELEYAASKLTSIEVNGTFYGSQKPASFRKWHDETPDDFVFALKGPRFATNRRILAEAGESIARFIGSGITELKAKLGPINWQFAPTKAFDAVDFEGFLAALPQEAEGLRLRHAVEVRHESFAVPEFIALARRYGVAIVTAVDSKYPFIADVTADFAYLRLMGTSEDHAAGYGPKAIAAHAARLEALAGGAKPEGLEPIDGKAGVKPVDVHAYVISGFKERNPAAAMKLIAALGA